MHKKEINRVALEFMVLSDGCHVMQWCMPQQLVGAQWSYSWIFWFRMEYFTISVFGILVATWVLVLHFKNYIQLHPTLFFIFLKMI